MKKSTRYFLTVFGFLALVQGHAFAFSQEYQVKAAFIYNFARFVEWPGKADEASPFVIGVLGQDPFGYEIDALTVETVHQRPVMIRRLQNVSQVDGCQMLFVPRSESARYEEILKRMEGKPVLTVGETAGFAEAGGNINFVLRENKIRFIINQKSVEKVGLAINSQLLSLADRVLT